MKNNVLFFLFLATIRVAMFSIRAPTRGAIPQSEGERCRGAFQSAHPRGVRFVRNDNRARQSRFNPRTCERCDRWEAPRWVAEHGFNPRTRVGCDGNTQQDSPVPSVFPSTQTTKMTQFRESVPTHTSLRPSPPRENVSILCSLWVRTRTFLWLISPSFVLRLQDFGRHHQTTFFWSNSRRPTKRRVRPC